MSDSRAVVIPETIRVEIGGAKLEVRYERVTGWQEHVLAAGRREIRLQEEVDSLTATNAANVSLVEKLRSELADFDRTKASVAALDLTKAALAVAQSSQADLERKVRELVTSTIGGQPASRTALECVVAVTHELNRAIKTIEEQGAALIAAGVGVR